MIRKSSPAIERYKNIIKLPASSFKQELRVARHKAWITAAQSCLNNQATAREVCLDWSQSTDNITKMAWDYCGLNEHALSLFALGKWGACELNLSSDRDFFIISENQINKDQQKLLLNFINMLNDNNEFGFAYRTDMDLRPGGRFGPSISSLAQAQDHYWNSGATWEKLALVRLRAICGTKSVTEAFYDIVNPFVFRKYLDYTLFEDLKNLRIKIHKSFIRGSKINIKLNPGGIRDIELFINALQVIHGGKISELRVSSTSAAINVMHKFEFFPRDLLLELEETYWMLRDLENHIQAFNDQQTHETELPVYHEIISRMTRAHEVISKLIGFHQELNSLDYTAAGGSELLLRAGFSEKSAHEVWPEIIRMTSKSTKTERDETARATFLNEFILCLSERPFGKDLGLELLKDFIKSTRAKATFFTTLLRDLTLIKDLAYIFSSSALIGNFVAARPELIDNLLLKREESCTQDLDLFLIDLVEQKKISQIHMVIKFLKDKNVTDLCLSSSAVADELCLKLLSRLKKETQIESTLEILALGKWGGNELGVASDLDFIFVTLEPPGTKDFKLARRFLSRLAEQQVAGNLYNYDLRLRPSGNSGPLLVSIDKLISYLKDEALAWERQSFLKARPLSRNHQLTSLFKNYIREGLSSQQLLELDDILAKLIKNNQTACELDLKYDKGGFLQIELTVQRSVLVNKLNISDPSMITMLANLNKKFSRYKKLFYDLSQNYLYLRTIEQLYQIKSNHSGSLLNLQSESFLHICLELDQRPDIIAKTIKSTLSENIGLLKQILNI